MNFPERVVTLRKQKGWTQQQLAEQVGVRVLQIRRYESRASRPTVDAKRNLALTLGVTKAVLESLILKLDANRFSATG